MATAQNVEKRLKTGENERKWAKMVKKWVEMGKKWKMAEIFWDFVLF